MSSTVDLYGRRREGKVHGDVFTSVEMINFMLDLVGYKSDRNLSLVKILEPSFGYGEFLMEIQRRIKASSVIHGFDPEEVMSRNVYACEIDERKFADGISRLRAEMEGFQPLYFKNEDFLNSSFDDDFDIIVGNPPYVRYENIPGKMRDIYKERFSCFHYRCDLYVLFYEHSLKMLAPNGKHCFICSNRWLKNEYGRKLRGYISASYSLDYILDVESIDAFQESVLAYPGVTLISKGTPENMTKVAVINDMADLKLPIRYTEKPKSCSDDWDNLFLECRMEGLKTLECQGFQVGIGVATGADSVFISDRFVERENIEKQLLMPLINAGDLTGDEFHWRGRYLLNPYSQNGSLIKLEMYPNAKRYLDSKREILESRHIVKNKKVWYSLIDKVKSDLREKPKILLPDISGNEMIFVDDGKFYPAHNIYYVVGRTKDDLTIVAAMLMSDFVKSQISKISTKMNGGMPRWQSRSIRKLRLPDVDGLSSAIKKDIIEAYNNRNLDSINMAMEKIMKNISGIQQSVKSCGMFNVPESIFDYNFSDSTSPAYPA